MTAACRNGAPEFTRRHLLEFIKASWISLIFGIQHGNRGEVESLASKTSHHITSIAIMICNRIPRSLRSYVFEGYGKC